MLGDAHMRQKTKPSFVQIMARRLLGAKPSSEPVLVYSWLDKSEQISVRFEFKKI